MKARATKTGLRLRERLGRLVSRPPGSGKPAAARGRRPVRLAMGALVTAAALLILVADTRDAWAPPNPAPIPVGPSIGAGGCFRCRCSSRAQNYIQSVVTFEHIGTRGHVTAEFELHRYEFIIDRFFRLYILNAMMSATQQATSVALQQMQIIGTFFDAKHQLEVQRLFQRRAAEAHRDYQPSTNMCEIGTSVRSLAASQRQGVVTAHILSQRALDRQLHSENVAAAPGSSTERTGRMQLFYTYYCDTHDNDDRLGELCNMIGAPTTYRHQTANNDIAYNRLIDSQATINSFFTEDFAGGFDGRALQELAVNLYAHQTPEPRSADYLRRPQNQPHHLTTRAIAAKRSVALNSFATIAGQRANGSEDAADTARFTGVILRQLGLTDAGEITAMLGNRPSYNAQMEILTKRLYQRPEFYTNLYTSEANVARTQASIRAIGLMQNFDMFKSRLRNEALLAVLIELELADEQARVINENRNLEFEGRRE